MSRVIDVRLNGLSDKAVYRFDNSDDVVEFSDDSLAIVAQDGSERRELTSTEDVENFIKAVMMAANIKEVKL